MDDHRKRAGDVAPTSPNKRPRVDPPLDPTALAAQIAEKKRLLQQQLQANGIASAPSPMPTGAPGHVRPAMPGAQQQQPRPTAQQQYQMPAAQQQYQQPPANAMLQAQEKARALAARFGATGVQPSAHNIPATQQQYHQRPPSNAAYTAHMSYALPPAPPKKGLFAEIHPALVVDKTTGQLDIKRESGAPLVPKAAFATTMANARAAQQVETKATAKLDEQAPDISKLPFFDPSLGGGSKARAAVRKGFKFVQKGTYVAQANQVRIDARLDKLRASIAEDVKKAGLEDELELVGDSAVKHDDVPEVEWWDTQLLPSMSYERLEEEGTVQMDDIVTNLVQHPVPIESSFESHSTLAQPVMLTKRERKKARRLRRMAALKEKQEKIRLGLLPPEQPKMKLANFMRVLGTEAILDPTQAEKVVRDQIQKRAMEHEAMNEERKLTDEQRKEKNRKKLEEDTSNLVHVAVFRIRDMTHPLHRTKVDLNAQQNNLTGVCIVHSNCSLVVVEGGPKGINRYKKLMLRRIDWTEKSATASADGSSSSTAKEENECVLAWEGTVRQGEFRGFRFKLCPTEARVKEALGEKCAHYFDLAKNFNSGRSL